jgi:uncharacterized protein (TIGR00725 family)
VRRRVIAVIGSGEATPDMVAIAKRVGQTIVDSDARLLTGGVGGVMAAASEGAHGASRYREGDVIGVLASYSSEDANPWVDIALPTGLGHARNAVVVAAADLVVLVGGDAGALSEAGLAIAIGRPLVIVESTGTAELLGRAWREREGVTTVGVDGLAAELRRQLGAR